MRADDWDRRYESMDLVWGAGPNQFVAAECGGLPPGRALDLACGEGRNAIWLAERGWRATGVDFSAVALRKAATLAGERGVAVEWIEADLDAHRPEPGGYDLVVLAYLQVPEASRAAIFAAAAAALAPGGTFLVVAHDSANLEHGVGGPQDPAVLYAPGDVTAHLDGLVIDRAETVTRRVTRPDGTTADALDCLVLAHRPGGPA